MRFDNGLDDDAFAALDFYEETGANILKAYTHNKEALRLHEKGFYKAAKHHAEHVQSLSLNAIQKIGLALELVKKIDQKKR
jgi:hypothetical protein